MARPGTFELGNKAALGNHNSGRPTKTEAAIKQAFIKAYWKGVNKRAKGFLAKFFDDEATPREIVKQLIPYARPLVEDEQTQPRPIQFIQFTAINNTVQLPTKELPDTVLVGDGRGEEAGSEGMASEKRQGHNRPEFHSFSHVGGKRR